MRDKNFYKIGQYYKFGQDDIVKILKQKIYNGGIIHYSVEIIKGEILYPNKGFDLGSPLGKKGIHLKHYNTPLYKVLNEV